MKKSEIVDHANSLIEMYKAGFLDGYRLFKKPRTNDEFITLNKHYRRAFMKRFEKKINKELKNAPVSIPKRKV